MNYITACPACGTQFLLTKEHLKAHRGKVQCGHCDHIFNAKNRVTEISDEITSTEEYQASLEDASQSNASLLGVDNSSQTLPTDFNQTSTDGPTYIGEFSSTITDSAKNIEIDTPIVIEDLAENPKYLKKSTKLNIGLFLFSLLLFITAIMQSVYFMRSKIAAEYPQFKPFLTQACVYLHCKIALPKDLDLLEIDDSDMQENEIYASVINFTGALINNAHYTQAYPNIELTLTNSEDQPVLRRLIKPAEYLNANTDVSIGFGAREEIRIKLTIHATDLTVAGYRVLLIY
ncbi:MAG: zinc-ribbon and DUF3426 domain-containing protein [Methylophilaceae bacterium]